MKNTPQTSGVTSNSLCVAKIVEKDDQLREKNEISKEKFLYHRHLAQANFFEIHESNTIDSF